MIILHFLKNSLVKNMTIFYTNNRRKIINIEIQRIPRYKRLRVFIKPKTLQYHKILNDFFKVLWLYSKMNLGIFQAGKFPKVLV